MSWWQEALCARSGLDIDWTDAGQAKENVMAALAICDRCQVPRECLTEGLRIRASGIWGGMVLSAGRASQEEGHPPREEGTPVSRGLLTARQKEVLEALARTGGDLPAAAADLGISYYTAREHLRRAAGRLGTVGQGRLATVLAAYRAGHIDIHP